ncbi:MAG: glycosyltransferase, partial [Planctomycetota bacterium]
MHARKSADSIQRFSKQFPDRPRLVVLTGTDLHQDIPRRSPPALKSLILATWLIFLEPQGINCVPKSVRDKSDVIFQSAEPVDQKLVPLDKYFEVTLVGHLRQQKDPFLAVKALQMLPKSSKVRILHIGKALSDSFQKCAIRWTKENAKYVWLGERTHLQTQRLLARSQLTLLTSKVEGAPSVVSEAVVNGVPILATRIPAILGTLGADYPGLFEVGDAEQLGN